MSSSSPVPIRRADANDQLSSSARNNLSSTPGGDNFFGSTPGGSRIVYSREQLLSLASSPLSQTPPHNLPLSSIPAEISRSPEKSQVGQSNTYKPPSATTASYSTGGPTGVGANGSSFSSSNGHSSIGGGGAAPPFGRSPEKASLRGLAAGNRAFGSTPGAATMAVDQGQATSSLAKSPPSNSSRSPGTAFNFSNGPVNPVSARNQSTTLKSQTSPQAGSFKEKLAQQTSPTRAVEGIDGDRKTPHEGQKAQSSTMEPNGSSQSHANSEEQFDMEM